MLFERRPWHEELAIVDRVMKDISDVTDPERMVDAYWSGIGELVPIEDYVALSRRGVAAPGYLVTRSSRFTEEINPWEERHRLPLLSGGLLGELAYADRPVFLDDVPDRLAPDDPGRFYLEGFQSLVALPQYEGGRGVNIGISLFPKGVEIDKSFLPMMHWQSSLFGRGTYSLVLRKQLTAALAALDRELDVVGQIQRSLLPARAPSIPGLDIATSYVTSARAGGDYYDFFPIAGALGEEWGLFIADVSGHGTPAAVLMAITHAIAHTRPGAPMPAGAMLSYLNGHLTRSYTTAGTFVTAYYATYNPHERTLVYATAGHNPPRLIRDGRVLPLDQFGGLPLGLSEAEEYHEATLKLRKGDLLVLYTDGITEAMAPPDAHGRRVLYDEERLDEVLLGCGDLAASACVERVVADVARFTRNAAPADDQTLVIARVV
jgi:sigma-B regulation protein RsbU (phosphoserine phosphatase)